MSQTTAGLTADGKHIANRARDEALNFRDTFRSPSPVSVSDLPHFSKYLFAFTHIFFHQQALAERLALYTQAYTLYSSVRPFGISTILAGVDEDGPALYLIEPSGAHWGYRACAVGKGRQLAKTELEKLDLAELTCQEGVQKAADMWVASEKQQ